MKFTEYRSKALKGLWKLFERDYVCRAHNFSTWRIDDICAGHWKHNYELSLCVAALSNYLTKDLLLKPKG